MPQPPNNKKSDILKVYVQLRSKLGNTIKIDDLIKAGYSKKTIEYHFQSLTSLDQEARLQFPDKFHDVHVDDLFTPKKRAYLEEVVEGCKRFVITTAVVGCQVDKGFYQSIKSYCKLNKAELLILLAADPAASAGWKIDKTLANDHVVLEETALNSNLFISTIKLSAKHIDPTTSMGRIGQRNGSFIYASPKQRLKMVPVANHSLPHAMMTTGAITAPNYKTRRYMSERTAYIAENDHVMGAIIVEIVDNKIYHFRQIQADSYGSFIDLGIQYNKDGSKETCAPEAFVLGDWHSGETDPSAHSAWLQVVKQLKPKYLVLHDTFNGLSINHHEKHNSILLAIRAQKGQLDLNSELKKLAADLEAWQKYVPKIVVVKSNHDEFLERYLKEGLYVKDPTNHRVSLKLALAMLDGKDPLQHGTEWFLNNPKNILWLRRDQDFKIARIQVGAHGDKGPNGARGSMQGMESAYGNCVTGHAHTPEILRGVFRVGTSSNLDLGYNVGPSSWLHSSCLVYLNGSRQLINSINGAWKS